MSGSALLAGRLIIIAGIANILKRDSVSDIEKELLERLIIDAVTVAEISNLAMSRKNRKKLADRLQQWQIGLISSEPTRVKLVILMAIMSSDMHSYLEESKNETKKKFVLRVYESVLDLVTVYDPDGELFEVEMPSVLDLVGKFFSLLKQ